MARSLTVCRWPVVGFEMAKQERMTAADYQKAAAENDIQAGICKYLAVKKIPHAVTDSSIVIARDGRPRRKVGTNGWPDVTAVLTGGQFLGIETKTAIGQLSADQIACHKTIRDAGGIVIVPRSIDDVREFIEGDK